MMAPGRRRTALIHALAATAILASGCGKAVPPSAPAAESSLPAEYIADVARQIALMMSLDHGSAVNTMPAAVSAEPIGPAFLSANTAAGDTTIVSAAITWTLSRQFFAAGGASQPAYDPATTELMVAGMRGLGVVSPRREPFTFRGTGRLHVTGLSAGEDTLTMTGYAYDTTKSVMTVRSYDTGRFYYTECRQILSDVRQLKPAAQHPWPISGTVVWTIAAERLNHNLRDDVEARFDISAVVRFDGTQTPRVEMSDGRVYRFDLRTGEIRE